MNSRNEGSGGERQERMSAGDTKKLALSSCGNGLDLRHKMTLRFVWKDNGTFNRKRQQTEARKKECGMLFY